MSLEDKAGHPQDFDVRYRFLRPEEGGRKGPVFQGYRSDFEYADRPLATDTAVWMIWPEFEDTDGQVLPEKTVVPMQGTARMWIVNDAYRHVHRERLAVGTRGFIVEGARRVAELEVTRIVGLHTNSSGDDE